MSLSDEPILEIDDIQGHILLGFRGGHQRLLGFRVLPGQEDALRAVLRGWLPRLTTSRQSIALRERDKQHLIQGIPLPDTGGLQVALSLSARALSLLAPGAGVPDVHFTQGAYRSAAGLRDDVDATGTPIGWAVGDRPETTPDLVFTLSAYGEASLAEAAASLREALAPVAAHTYTEAGAVLPDEREHFGFIDGISQPAVRGTLDGSTPLARRLYPPEHPLADRFARPGQPLVWPGQFVFGYPTQLLDSDAPGPVSDAPLLRNGSLLVYRRLRQDVSAFRAAMAELAETLEVSPEKAAALCVGRWPDGTPVSLSPDGPDPDIGGHRTRRNGFAYDAPIDAATLRSGEAFPGAAADPDGLGCPFFGHIRKVNPRDQVVDQSRITLRSQMLRRGIPYGPAWTASGDADDRGLLFLSYQTSIENQFNRLMTLWVNNAFAPPPGHGIDPIIGTARAPGRALTRPRLGQRSQRAILPGRWVTAAGALYLFTPGLSALREVLGADP